MSDFLNGMSLWVFSFVLFPLWLWRYYLINEQDITFKGKIKTLDTSGDEWIIELDNGIVFSWSGEHLRRRCETSNGWHWENTSMTRDVVETAYEEGDTVSVGTRRCYLDAYLDGETTYPKALFIE